MSSDEIGPSTLLTGRYRLEELLAETSSANDPAAGPVRTWRAVDEVLSRPVVAHVVDRDHPRAQDMVTAARAAAAVNDPRLIRVFDAHTEGVAYVIREWFDADSLASTVLGSGPLDPDRAGQLARNAAEALAFAHGAGMAHRWLDPHCVLLGDDDAVKILGLGIDLALRGLPDDAARPELWADPGARDDARGLGLVLHAALTGRWAGTTPSTLSAAPRTAAGRILSPRQCRPGVPRGLDLITERSVDDHPRHGEPLRSPAEVAAALADAGVGPDEAVPAFTLPPVAGVLARQPNFGQPTDPDIPLQSRVAADYDTEYSLAAQADDAKTPVPLASVAAGTVVTSGPQPTDGGSGGGSADNGGRAPGGRGNPRPAAPASYQRRRFVVGVVGIIVLAGFVLLGWQLTTAALSSHGDQPTGGATPTASATATDSPEPTPTGEASSTPTTAVLRISDSGDFDPLGDGGEHPNQVRYATDRDRSTSWTTMQYFGSPNLGNLKSGVGMWIDLGEAKAVSSVHLDLEGTGTNLEVRVPDNVDAAAPPGAIGGWRTVGKAEDAGASVDVTIDPATQARFVLVWLTKLPPDGTGNYRGGIQEIVARG